MGSKSRVVLLATGPRRRPKGPGDDKPFEATHEEGMGPTPDRRHSTVKTARANCSLRVQGTALQCHTQVQRRTFRRRGAQAGPCKFGGVPRADQGRKERNRKRKERRKNLKAKMRQQAAPTVEPRPDATGSENPGTDTASHGNGVRRKGSDTAPPPSTSPPTVPQRYVGEQYRENGDGQTVPVASNITTAPNSSLMDSTSMDCVD